MAGATVERLHVQLAAMLEVSSEQTFGGDAAARASVLRWLASPRPLGQLHMLMHLLNRGLVVCTNLTGNEWEAEVLQCQIHHSNRPAVSDSVQGEDDLGNFEAELAALNIDPLPRAVADLL